MKLETAEEVEAEGRLIGAIRTESTRGDRNRTKRTVRAVTGM
jgi:hypothetical protein